MKEKQLGFWVSEFFPSHLGVKQGCPLGHNPFGLYIDEFGNISAAACHGDGKHGLVVAVIRG